MNEFTNKDFVASWRGGDGQAHNHVIEAANLLRAVQRVRVLFAGDVGFSELRLSAGATTLHFGAGLRLRQVA